MASIMKRFAYALLCTVATSALGMSFNNFYEVYYRHAFDLDRRATMAWVALGGFDPRGFNAASNGCNILQILNGTQSSIAMLKGFNEDSPESNLLALIDAEDDGTRGHFCVTGSLNSLISTAYITRVALRHGFMLGLYVPIIHAHLHSVCWRDLTQDSSVEDMRVKEDLTNHFFSIVNGLDSSLDLQMGWSRTGAGDSTLLMEWQRDFPQPKPILKHVQINARLGFSFPTGLREDSNKLFAFPFGNNGATGLVFGGCLGLNLMERMWTGVDVELTHLFDSINSRRIKIDVDQTDLLLLTKACVHNDWGMIQRFNLFLTADPLIDGLSLAFYYQFLKRGRTDIIVNSSDYDSNIANTANYLKEWVSHTAIFRLKYDAAAHLPEGTRLHPSFAIYGQFPFRGRRAAVWSSVGAMFTLAF